MPPQSESRDFYGGSRLLTPLAALSGLTIDQVNFLVCQLVAAVIGFPFRKYLDPRTTSPNRRHTAELLLGIFLVYFCFGSQILHLFVHATLGYVLLQFHAKKWMPIAVFVVGMAYLSWCHICRMILDYGGYTLDITGPLMICVQKITSVAYALHDGTYWEEKDLNANQKNKAIKEKPNALTFYSYIFCFHGVMCGPFPFFHDYVAFIDGSCYNQDGKPRQNLPSPVAACTKKFIIAVILGALMMIEPLVAPWQKLMDDDYLYEYSWPHKMIYLLCSMSMHRPMYYFAWKLAEMVNNQCGFGFSGYDENGNGKWDLLNNVEIYKLEMSTSLKVNIESWNVLTAQWLRYTVYERVPQSVGVWAVFVVSAFWHGFYPGYYISFITAALFTTAARLVRRNIRPYFLQSTQHMYFYDFVTFWFTRFTNCYFVSPFVVLELMHVVRLYTSLCWWLHILAIGVIVYYNFIQKMIRPARKTEKVQ